MSKNLIAPSTIPCPLRLNALTRSGDEALAWAGRSLNWRQLDEYVSSAGRSLKERGVRPGERVAIVSPNCVEYIIVLFALWRVKAVACLLSPRLPSEGILRALKDLKVKVILSGQSPSPNPSPEGRGNAMASPPPGGGARGGEKFRQFNFFELIRFDARDAFFSSLSTEELKIELNQDTAILFTSGTSAEPKAALLSYGNFYWSALGANMRIPLNPGDRWLLSLPLYHVGGLGIVFRALAAGAAVYVPKEKEDWGQWLVREKITHVSLVATQLYRLFNSPPLTPPPGGGEALIKSPTKEGESIVFPLPSGEGRGEGKKKANFNFSYLKVVLLGGSAIPRDLLKEALAHNLPIFLTYGLTEMASQVATGRLVDPDKPCVQILPYREMKISPDGEILVRGETLFKGYVGKFSPPLTPPQRGGETQWLPLPPGEGRGEGKGWFPTGDFGFLDAEGCLSVTGRKDNLFISGGENIQPEEIERSLEKIPGVIRAVVVGFEDREFGFRPAAFVQFKEDREMSAEELRKFLGPSLPRFKIPTVFYTWPEKFTPPLTPPQRGGEENNASQKRGNENSNPLPPGEGKINRKFFAELLTSGRGRLRPIA